MRSDAALDYLYSLGMFGIKLGLDNIRALLERLGNPHTEYPVIHIAGTNGKGSVCAFLEQIYTRGGYRVGVYTSPHLEHFNERIRIGSELIPTQQVVAITDEIRAVAEDIQPTFFEFSTAMALVYFARKQVDLVVLEVGMGGRLDATNVVTPALSIIAPIAYDHADHLGHSLTEIAAEKGGIIKPRVPLVLGVQTPEVEASLQAIAIQKDSLCYRHGSDYCVTLVDGGGEGSNFDVITPRHAWKRLSPGLNGQHQGQNLGMALMALDVLEGQGFKVEAEQVVSGVTHTHWPGRLEWIYPVAGCAGKILLDGAHNSAGLMALQCYLSQCNLESVHWVGGFKKDKNAPHMVPVLRDHVDMFYAVPVPVEVSWEPHDLVAIAAAAKIDAQAYVDVETALARAIENCKKHGVVLIAGSLFLVAEARRILGMR